MRRFVTRRRLAELNSQEWADFRAHWPMRIVSLVADLGIGTLLGAGLGFALALWLLYEVGGLAS